MIRWAAAFASDQGATLRLVHVIPTTEEQNLHGFDPDYGLALSKRANELMGT